MHRGELVNSRLRNASNFMLLSFEKGYPKCTIWKDKLHVDGLGYCCDKARIMLMGALEKPGQPSTMCIKKQLCFTRCIATRNKCITTSNKKKQ